MMVFLYILLISNLGLTESPASFSSFKGNSQISITKHPYSSALFIDENCSNCKDLIKQLDTSCSSFNPKSLVIFATGRKKKLAKKLRPLLKKGAQAYFHPNLDTLIDAGLTAVPSYSSQKKELHVGNKDSFQNLMSDKVCTVKTNES